MCMCFRLHCQYLFTFFNLWTYISHFWCLRCMSGYLKSATPRQFYSDILKLCRCFVHWLKGIIVKLFFIKKNQLVNLSFFAISEDNEWVLYDYNFIPIFLKLFCKSSEDVHGLGIIIKLFSIIFLTCELFVIFGISFTMSGYFVSATPPTVSFRSFWNFASICTWSRGYMHVVWILLSH